MKEPAYSTLVDAVHCLMKLEKWDEASVLNKMRIKMLFNPRLQDKLYREALTYMQKDPELVNFSNRMYNILEGKI